MVDWMELALLCAGFFALGILAGAALMVWLVNQGG